MRFRDRATAISTIRAAIDSGFNYIDTSPTYCFKGEYENSESWVGEAINYKDYRNRVMVSAKCSPGNGGLQWGNLILNGDLVYQKQQLIRYSINH